MSKNPKHDRAWLLANSRAIAARLKTFRTGTRLRIRIPHATARVNTDGWSATIGDLGKGTPKLEVWLDRFSGYRQRKLFACFRSHNRYSLLAMKTHVHRRLWPARTITTAEIDEGRDFVLRKRLGRSEFNTPILEKYRGGVTFYGIYDLTRQATGGISRNFCSRAQSFFEDVARAQPHAVAGDEQADVYPKCENRKTVAKHLRRERSKLLAAECKIRDDYQCQVCGLRYEAAYGKLGQEFAEAHHLIPLSTLRENVRTRLEDLATVCSNCHRMLHRMAGTPHDVRKLRNLVRRQRSRMKKQPHR